MESLKHWQYVGLQLKASHQKNLLKSAFLVYISISLLIGYIFFWPRAAESPIQSVTVKTTTSDGLSMMSLPAGSDGSKVWSGSGSSQLAVIYNSLGHNKRKVRIVRDDLPNQVMTASPRIEPALAVDDIAYPPSQPGTVADGPGSLNSGGGTGDLYGLGDNTFGLPGGIYSRPYERNPGHEQTESGGLIEAPVYLALAVPSYPEHARPNDTGVVVVDITVSKKGYVSYNILSIEPAGYGFAAAAEHAIINGRYSPRFVEGVAVDHTIRLTLVMSKNSDPQADGAVAEFTYSSPTVRPTWLVER